MVKLWTSKIGGNVIELRTQGTTTSTSTWLSVTSMRRITHVYSNGQAAHVHQHGGYSPLHAHYICLTAHTHPGNSARPKSKHTKSYCQPLTLLHLLTKLADRKFSWAPLSSSTLADTPAGLADHLEVIVGIDQVRLAIADLGKEGANIICGLPF